MEINLYIEAAHFQKDLSFLTFEPNLKFVNTAQRMLGLIQRSVETPDVEIL